MNADPQVPVHPPRIDPIQRTPILAITAADFATATVALIICIGIVALAVRQQPIPDVLALSLASIIAYYFGRSSRV